MAEEAAEKPGAAAAGTDAKSRPATDIQAALTVLGRLPHRPETPRADLSEAQLSGAQLAEANLSGALLVQANLSGANFNDANLTGAFVKQTDLRKTDLSQEQLNSADGDANPRLPDGLQRPDHWGVRNTG